jgi:hypothetical protein
LLSLAKIKSLEHLFLMKNGISNLEFPECEYNEKTECFPNLKTLNVRENPIVDDVS